MAPDITETVVITDKPQTLTTTEDNNNNHISSNGGVRQRNQSQNQQHIRHDSTDKILITNGEIGVTKVDANSNNLQSTNNKTNKLVEQDEEFRAQLRWPDFLVQIFIHGGAIYGLYLLTQVKFLTILWFIALVIGTGFGITAGAHRLWSHKSYKATWQLRLVLIFLFTIAGQRDAYTWAHDHRVHHKYSETDADPHDARRGFWFSHVGWLFLTPHPEVVAKRKIIDLTDLEADEIVMFQKKFYIPLFALLVIAFPIAVPYYLWNESLWLAFWTVFVCRFCTTLNIAFFVNSVAHMYGSRPYDKKISPAESFPVAIAAFGEGWHNYHHVFPWDYKTSELGDYKYNVSTWFIDSFAKIGWAYDRKSVSPEMVARRAAKCGDGSHIWDHENAHKNAVWGFGDTDIPCEDIEELKNMHA